LTLGICEGRKGRTAARFHEIALESPPIGGRSHDAVIRVYGAAGNVIETHEHKGEFK
jgi:hypothetical protein